ncbi:MAG: FAD:protein FMN transferase [Pirellulales bacterium]|nr:FAD:protein FMN transferase [Pirellulales bacterium]
MLLPRVVSQFAWLALLLVLSAGGTPGPAPNHARGAELQRFTATERHMGMSVRVVLYAPSADEAQAGFAAVFGTFARLNQVFSDYLPDSELMRLCKTANAQPGTAVSVSADLFRIITLGQQLSRQTEGAFDVTIGPLTQLWRKSKRTRALPAPEVLEQAKAALGYKKLLLDPRQEAVTFLRGDLRLDLGGIAVGYTIDQALAELKKLGIERAMIDASGDIGCSGPPPGQTGWRIGLTPLDPEAPANRYVRLAHGAITTSGDAFQSITIDGTRYSHIVDPATGLGCTRWSATTVIARDCVTADSLATAISVLGPERGLPLLSKYPGTEAVLLVGPATGQPTPDHSSPSLENSSASSAQSAQSPRVVEYFSSGLQKLLEEPTLAPADK